MTSEKEILIIGLSGPSSSGKTTLARLLREIYNCSPVKFFIIHEDDFYKTDTLIPRRVFSSEEFGTRELDDWDCVESLDLPLLRRVLTHVKQNGTLPDDFASKEDQNTIGKSGVDDDVVQKFKKDLQSELANLGDVTICLLDGFLLYPDPGSESGSSEKELRDILEPLFNLKLFLASTREQTIERRTKRTGYVTLEGFWEDPPGFVQDLVWPNYVKYHAWMFGDQDTGTNARNDKQNVEAVDQGRVNRRVTEDDGIYVGPGDGEKTLNDILPWAIDKIKTEVKRS